MTKQRDLFRVIRVDQADDVVRAAASGILSQQSATDSTIGELPPH